MRIGTGRSWRASEAFPVTVVKRKTARARIAAACASLRRGRMRRTILVAVVVALLHVPSAPAAATQLMPGVSYQRVLRWAAAGPGGVFVVDAPEAPGPLKLTPPLSDRAILPRRDRA